MNLDKPDPGDSAAEENAPLPDESEPSAVNASGFENNYTENRFWSKLNGFAKNAGRELVHKSLCLYYAAQRPETPAWAKAAVYSALGYFILPTDAIPDLTPILGFSDDLGAITLALATIATYVTPQIKAQARDKMEEWFGPGEE